MTVEGGVCLRLDQDSKLGLQDYHILGENVDQLQLWERVFQGSWAERRFDLRLFHWQNCQILSWKRLCWKDTSNSRSWRETNFSRREGDLRSGLWLPETSAVFFFLNNFLGLSITTTGSGFGWDLVKKLLGAIILIFYFIFLYKRILNYLYTNFNNLWTLSLYKFRVFD